MLKKIVILAILLGLAGAVFALDDQGNPNDPRVNERANACYEDGSLAGKCVTPADWEAGWYLIRFEHGMIARDAFPAQYAYVLPPLVVSGEAPGAGDVPPPVVNCVHIYSVGGVPRYVNFGASDHLNYYPSANAGPLYDDATCTNQFNTLLGKIVLAPGGAAAAETACQTYFAVPMTVTNLNDTYACGP